MIKKACLILCCFLMFAQACQEKKVYQEDDGFNWFTNANDSIFPTGTYMNHFAKGPFSKVVFYNDSENCKILFIDSLQQDKTITSTWKQIGYDTQYFDFPAPFGMAYFYAESITFFDSSFQINLIKKADTMVDIFFDVAANK